MGWSELRAIPNEYNDEIRSIDEKVLTLIQERKSFSKGKRIFPPQEIIQEWASQFEMDIPQINWFMHCLNHRELPNMPNEPGELLNVISIMKKTSQEGFEYLITHAMQHEYGSMVNVEVRSEKADQAGHIRPKLLLEVIGDVEYHARSRGSRGGGGQAQLNFLIRPRLPDDMKELKFALIPFASPVENPPKEIILDREVHFET